MYSAPSFYFSLLVSVVFALGGDFFYKAHALRFRPVLEDFVQNFEAAPGGEAWAEKRLKALADTLSNSSSSSSSSSNTNDDASTLLRNTSQSMGGKVRGGAGDEYKAMEDLDDEDVRQISTVALDVAAPGAAPGGVGGGGGDGRETFDFSEWDGEHSVSYEDNGYTGFDFSIHSSTEEHLAARMRLSIHASKHGLAGAHGSLHGSLSERKLGELPEEGGGGGGVGVSRSLSSPTGLRGKMCVL
jgi:hypothetical protein